MIAENARPYAVFTPDQARTAESPKSGIFAALRRILLTPNARNADQEDASYWTSVARGL